MALPTPPPYTNPIPNNPFYSPLTWTLQGPVGPLIVGSGLNISATGVISSTGGGGGGVTSIIAGTGINVNQATGNVTVTNTGVTSLAAGTGILLSGTSGAVTITNLKAGTVTQVNTGSGLTGGPITNVGSISLTPTGVIAGSYTNANITVDSFGRIATASNGTSGGGTVTAVTGTAPIVSSGGTTPAISLASSGVTPGLYTAPTITIDAFGRITTAVNNSLSNGTVTSIIAGTGLTGGTITTSGTIALSNTAVIAGSYTNTSLTVDSQGRITAASNGVSCTGTVTSITAGTGLTGGTITTSGTVDLADTAVAPGTYNFATITVDQQGRLTAASTGSPPTPGNTTVTSPITNSGTALNPNIGIQTASTGQLGAVQVGSNISVASGVISVCSTTGVATAVSNMGVTTITDNVTSISCDSALSANQGRALQQQINALLVTGTVELAGTIDGSTALVSSVT